MPKVTFLPSGKAVEFGPGQVPFQEDGLPGSLLDIALGNGVSLEHACGGHCACTTCHVIVREGMENLSEMSEAESDRLDRAVGVTLRSRLACQAVLRSGEVVAEIPRHNRNEGS
ncbi:MAG TPA: 2Fe-2S iron-sulfur cluster-binding protein [Candidatus Omnitrophota bacterium]|nr:2Fe-2S iron-sulfur cluster-binding protein [Candidatus Omnitrophota bacterium]